MMKTKVLTDRVNLIASLAGLYKGLYQIPFHLIVCMALINTGITKTEAISLMFIWTIGTPRLMSFAFEYFGGVISHKLGNLGSIRCLIYSQVIRGITITLFPIPLIFSESIEILTSSLLIALLGEFGRSLMSGSFEDTYKQSAQIETESPASLIADLDYTKRKYEKTSLFIIAPLTLAVIFASWYIQENSILYIFFFLPAIPYIKSIQECIKWKNHLNYNIRKHNHHTTEDKSLYRQTMLFLRRPEFFFSIAMGSFQFIFAYSISLSAISQSDVLHAFETETLLLGNELLAILLSILPSFFLVLGMKKLLPDQDKLLFLKTLSPLKIFIYLFTWLLIATITLALKPLLYIESSILISCLLAFLWGPLAVWEDWMRTPLTQKTSNLFPKIICTKQNNAFYYSLIEGTKETTLAVITFTLILFKYSKFENTFLPAVTLAAILSLSSFLTWAYLEKYDGAK